jgi:hypothetical protein
MASTGNSDVRGRGEAFAAASVPHSGGALMKIAKSVLLVLCVCSLCSKAVMHTYRHFHPAPTEIVGP